MICLGELCLIVNLLLETELNMKWMENDVTEKAACCPAHLVQLKLLSILMKHAVEKRLSERFVFQLKHRLASIGRECNASVHYQKIIRIISSRTKIRIIQRKLASVFDIEGDRPIHLAVANEDLELTHRLCFLMKNSVSLDITNYLKQTPLHLAVMLGNVGITKLLLTFGASPLICDRNGNSVLHLAAKSKCTNVLNILLLSIQSKSILNVMDHEGYSALHYAVLKNNGEAVKMLHEHGANMNKIDGKSGRTPLIHAVLGKSMPMVDLLLNYGACPQKADYSGRTAIDMALQTGNVQLIKLLEKWILHSVHTSSIKEQVKPSINSSIKMRKKTM